MQHITPEIWQRVKKVAGAALDLDADARQVFIERECAGDAALRAEVLSLLAAADAAAPLYETPGGGDARLYALDSRIGPYRIVRELGSGGMGSVYLAERDDGQFYQRVAIKIVRDGFGSTFLLERFREERRILASLEHPNIARLLDGGTTATGLPYVAMEFVEGEPIDRFCEGRRLPLNARLALFQPVCAAVQYAHDHLVIHRDIKAANILVTSDGVPKLLDFGIAKLLTAEAGAPRGTTMVRVMTPESASPEQLAGRPVTVATDVYALGLLLYRLLTGGSPYRGSMSGDADLIRAVCEQEPERPGARPQILAEPLSTDVDMIVLKALHKEPERRYGSPGRLADDIQRYLEGRPVLASPDSVRYRARKFIGRHRVAVVAGCAVLASIVAGAAMALREARVAERERLKAESEFNAVRGFAQSMLGEMNQAVVKLPGSTVAREILLRRATGYLDALFPEAQNDDVLRREVARGYGLLSQVQGTDGLQNIGDATGSRTSLAKAVALLEPLAGPPRGTLTDRMFLAHLFARLAASDPTEAEKRLHLGRARGIIDALSATEASTFEAIDGSGLVWEAVANKQIDEKDYAAALVSMQRVFESAEACLRARPGELSRSRDLSLSYKRLGALLEVLNRRPEAIPLYEKALELDRDRVSRDPAQPMWQLDLSFSQASIGAALVADGDIEHGRPWIEQAVALRERAVAIDPADDFAQTSLARGYQRLADIRGRQGDLRSALDNLQRRVDVYRRRLEAHPERDHLWREYNETLLDAAATLQELLASRGTRPDVRREYVPHAMAFLDEIAIVQQRWEREKHTGGLPPTVDTVLKGRAALESLIGPPTALRP